MEKIKVGVAGAGGYAGIELVRLLLMHPGSELQWVMSEPSHEGVPLSRLFPHLKGSTDLVCKKFDPALSEGVELVFLAMPHGLAIKTVPEFLKTGCRVSDISADYRLRDPEVFQQWYKVEHTSPELLGEVVYGLTELYRGQLPGARLVANPGCYPTVSILSLAPLLREGWIDPDSIVIDAKSGVSGAGRGLTLVTHYPECNEDVRAYSPGVHRHAPEIDQELTRLAGKKTCVLFVPHLMPMTRGMLASIYAVAAKSVGTKELVELYRSFYKDEPFIRVLEEGELPSTKHVWGTNLCEISVSFESRSGKILIIGVIDNLLKGASGQAIQNMNVVFGFPETTGLQGIGIYP
jgi:N-acetyl-gamma-glutamyl-phosphate reductase